MRSPISRRRGGRRDLPDVEDPDVVAIVPALRLPPDEKTVARIHDMSDLLGGRQLTDLEVLACLPAEGTA